MDASLEKRVGALENLKKTWLIWSFLMLFGLIGGGWLMSRVWRVQETLGWIILSGGVMVFQLVFLRSHLPDNHPVNRDALNPRLGWANWVSIIRGGLLALLFGFAAGPWPDGWARWFPGGVYLIASVMDFVDGYIARVTMQETVLGERLDMSLDGMGVLAASCVAIHYGQLPFWYLLVGLARYFYLIGSRLVTCNGKTLRPLKPNRFRRALAGAQMGFIAVVLLPVFYPPVTRVAALFFAMPFLVNFLLDWLWVSGITPEEGFKLPRFSIVSPAQLKWVLPLFFRLGLSVSIATVLIRQDSKGWVWTALLVMLVGVCFGAAGRTMALGVVLLSAWLLQQSPANVVYWLQLSFGTALFFSGTGSFSVWSPENWLIYHRPGEKSRL